MIFDEIQIGTLYYVKSGFRKGHMALVTAKYPKSQKIKVEILNFNALVNASDLTLDFPKED